jgi:Cu/Ag efflux protein CusF
MNTNIKAALAAALVIALASPAFAQDKAQNGRNIKKLDARASVLVMEVTPAPIFEQRQKSTEAYWFDRAVGDAKAH